MTTQPLLDTWQSVGRELSDRRIPWAWVAEYLGTTPGVMSTSVKTVNRERSVTLPDPDAIAEAIDAIEGGWRPEGRK